MLLIQILRCLDACFTFSCILEWMGFGFATYKIKAMLIFLYFSKNFLFEIFFPSELSDNTQTSWILYMKRGISVVEVVEYLRILCWLYEMYVKCICKIPINFLGKSEQTFVIHVGMGSCYQQGHEGVAIWLNFWPVERGKISEKVCARGRVVYERLLFSFDSADRTVSHFFPIIFPALLWTFRLRREPVLESNLCSFALFSM